MLEQTFTAMMWSYLKDEVKARQKQQQDGVQDKGQII